MVVDLQGVAGSEEGSGRRALRLTDPQIHSDLCSDLCSLESKYGLGDRGRRGFDDFFRTHRCGALCEALGLQRPDDTP